MTVREVEVLLWRDVPGVCQEVTVWRDFYYLTH